MSPGDLDARVVRRHLAALHAALGVLERHAGRPVEALRESAEERWTVERGLQICAQNALDAATHVAAAAGRDVPDYAGAIDALSQIGALDRGFAAEFRDVAGFRNVLVRGYLDVDLAIVHRVLNERLPAFRAFAQQLEHYLTAR